MNIVIPVNKKQFPLVLVVSLLITLGIAGIIIRQGPGQHLIYGLPDWLFLFAPVYFLSISLAEYIKTLFGKNTLLRISDAGVEDNLSIVSCGSIPWNEISGLALSGAGKDTNVVKPKFFLVKLNDPEKIIAKQAFWKRHILKKYLQR